MLQVIKNRAKDEVAAARSEQTRTRNAQTQAAYQAGQAAHVRRFAHTLTQLALRHQREAQDEAKLANRFVLRQASHSKVKTRENVNRLHPFAVVVCDRCSIFRHPVIMF